MKLLKLFIVLKGFFSRFFSNARIYRALKRKLLLKATRRKKAAAKTALKKGEKMKTCTDCGKAINEGYSLTCPNCGATVCSACGEKNKKICPFCYSDLDFTD